MLHLAWIAVMSAVPFQFTPSTPTVAIQPAPLAAKTETLTGKVGGTTFVAFLKGTSETTADDKFKFNGFGSITIDEGSGQLTYSFLLDNGFTFSGSGVAAVSEKNNVNALIDVESGGTVDAGGISGQGILDGKVDRNRTKFKGSLIVAVPNRLGPAPAGFVLSKIKIAGIVDNEGSSGK